MRITRQAGLVLPSLGRADSCMPATTKLSTEPTVCPTRPSPLQAVAGAAYFLPPYDLRQATLALTALRERQEAAAAALQAVYRASRGPDAAARRAVRVHLKYVYT